MIEILAGLVLGFLALLVLYALVCLVGITILRVLIPLDDVVSRPKGTTQKGTTRGSKPGGIARKIADNSGAETVIEATLAPQTRS